MVWRVEPPQFRPLPPQRTRPAHGEAQKSETRPPRARAPRPRAARPRVRAGGSASRQGGIKPGVHVRHKGGGRGQGGGGRPAGGEGGRGHERVCRGLPLAQRVRDARGRGGHHRVQDAVCGRSQRGTQRGRGRGRAVGWVPRRGRRDGSSRVRGSRPRVRHGGRRAGRLRQRVQQEGRGCVGSRGGVHVAPRGRGTHTRCHPGQPRHRVRQPAHPVQRVHRVRRGRQPVVDGGGGRGGGG